MSDENNIREEIPREPVFYYSRERRLSRASPAVQAMNKEKPVRRGLLQSFFGSKSNIMLFISILIICAVFSIALRFFGGQGVKLGGNTLAAVILNEEGPLVVQIVKKAPKSGEVYLGAVDIAVYPVLPESKGGEAPGVFTKRFFFNPVESETFRASLPFGGTDFFVIFRTGEEQKSIRIRVKGSQGKR